MFGKPKIDDRHGAYNEAGEKTEGDVRAYWAMKRATRGFSRRKARQHGHENVHARTRRANKLWDWKVAQKLHKAELGTLTCSEARAKKPILTAFYGDGEGAGAGRILIPKAKIRVANCEKSAGITGKSSLRITVYLRKKVAQKLHKKLRPAVARNATTTGAGRGTMVHVGTCWYKAQGGHSGEDSRAGARRGRVGIAYLETTT